MYILHSHVGDFNIWSNLKLLIVVVVDHLAKGFLRHVSVISCVTAFCLCASLCVFGFCFFFPFRGRRVTWWPFKSLPVFSPIVGWADGTVWVPALNQTDLGSFAGRNEGWDLFTRLHSVSRFSCLVACCLLNFILLLLYSEQRLYTHWNLICPPGESGVSWFWTAEHNNRKRKLWLNMF